MKTKLLLIGTALIFSSVASADIITIQLNGHVLPYMPGNPIMGLDATGVFGAANTYLNGDAYTATITYDTGSAPSDAYPADPNYSYYERQYYTGGPSFLDISVTISGHTEDVTGLTNYQLATLSSSSNQDSVFFATSNHGHDSSTGAAFDESYADFIFNSIPGQFLVGSDALPTSVDLNALDVSPNTKIGDLTILRGTYGTGPGGSNTYSAEVDSLYLGLDSVTSWSGPPTSATPEPAGLPLLAIGIAACIIVAKRKASQSRPVLHSMIAGNRTEGAPSLD